MGMGWPQHAGLGLDAAHAPAQHAQAVDHGGVRVGAHQAVRVGQHLAVALGGEDHPGQVLDVHLVDDAGVGRHHREVAEGVLAPAQEGVALLVAAELDLAVQGQASFVPELVDLHRVIDDQLGRQERVHPGGIAAHLLHRLAHGRQVHHRRHAGEVLQDHPRRHEGDLGGGRGLGIPAASALMCAGVTVRPSSVRSSISSSTAARRAGG
jgi:hypothetical protein